MIKISKSNPSFRFDLLIFNVCRFCKQTNSGSNHPEYFRSGPFGYIHEHFRGDVGEEGSKNMELYKSLKLICGEVDIDLVGKGCLILDSRCDHLIPEFLKTSKVRELVYEAFQTHRYDVLLNFTGRITSENIKIHLKILKENNPVYWSELGQTLFDEFIIQWKERSDTVISEILKLGWDFPELNCWNHWSIEANKIDMTHRRYQHYHLRISGDI